MAPPNSNAVIATVFIGCLNKIKNQSCGIDRYSTLLFGDSPNNTKIDLDPTSTATFNLSYNRVTTLGNTSSSSSPKVVGLSVN